MRLRLPHPLLLLTGGVFLAALLTWLLPAGEFERRDDPASGRSLVVAGTYHAVEARAVGPLGAMVAIPRGLVAGADVVISILIVGGAFALVEMLGTLRRGIDVMVRRFEGRGIWVIPVVALVFGTFGALENMQEEIIALIPVLLVLGRGLGVNAIGVLGMSYGAAAVGSAFGPTNPFQAGIALKLAQLPLLQGGGLRLTMLVTGIALWSAFVMWYARRNAVPPVVEASGSSGPFTRRDTLIVAIILGAFATYVVGVLRFEWGFNELSALFFFAAIGIGIVGGLSMSDSASQFIVGMQSMVGAGMIVGVSRAISVVLTDGRVIDTIVNGLASPLIGRPPALAALLMIPVHNIIHLAVPSVSGQAALTMPILIPTSDLIGLSRQATVLAFQTGAGIGELLIPTNGALMAMLLAAKVPFSRWLTFAVPGFLLMTVFGALGVLAGLRLR
jgi:uncharacterized ion transporter superfamily protein YfcC